MKSTMLMVFMLMGVIILLLLDQKGHTVFSNNYIDLTHSDDEDEEVQVCDHSDDDENEEMVAEGEEGGELMEEEEPDQCIECTNMTDRFAPYCESCSPVEVAMSSIPGAGRGLFAKRKIKGNEKIANYMSGTRRMTKDEFNEVYPDNLPLPTHVWSPDGKTFYDGIDTNKSIAGLANTGRTFTSGIASQPNTARLRKSGMLRAGRGGIPKGKEVLIAYNW